VTSISAKPLIILPRRNEIITCNYDLPLKDFDMKSTNKFFGLCDRFIKE